MDVKFSLPLLPLRDIVVFPNMVIPLFVGRDKSISALNEVMKNDKKIILVTQKNSEVDDPKKTDVFMYGCEGSILQLLKLPDGTVKVLVEGIKRVKILEFKDNEKFITCEFTPYIDLVNKDEDLYPLAATALRRLEKLTSINKKISHETINTIKQLKEPSQIADNIASHITATISEKQQIFETIDVKKRLNAIIKIMENEASIIGVEKRIRGRVKTQMEKTQREYYLNEQLKAIQKELGEIEDGKDETTSLNKAILKAKMPKEVEKKCMSELKKLKTEIQILRTRLLRIASLSANDLPVPCVFHCLFGHERRFGGHNPLLLSLRDWPRHTSHVSRAKHAAELSLFEDGRRLEPRTR